MSSSEAESRTPRFSMVVATYNVAPYLGEFIASVEGQTFPLDRLQVIAVDDGSTDDSGAILEAWQRRRPELVTVVSKPNGGLPSARNAGLPHVRGEWVTFTDPDDILGDSFFAEVDAFLSRRPEAFMVATNRAPFNEATGEAAQTPAAPPLRRRGQPTAQPEHRRRTLPRPRGVDVLPDRRDPACQPPVRRAAPSHVRGRPLLLRLSPERAAADRGLPARCGLPLPQAWRRHLAAGPQLGRPRPVHRRPRARLSLVAP